MIGSGFAGIREAPDSETADGFDVLDQYFGGIGTGLGGEIVFTAPQGVDDPAVQAAMSEMFAEANKIESTTVTDPYSRTGGAISPDGTVGFASVELAASVSDERSGLIGEEIQQLAPTVDGLQVEIGGAELAVFEPPQSEVIGLGFAILILILATGSVLAMGLPISVALFGVSGGVGATILLSNISGGPEFSTTLAVMVGLGVGIDYALFIMTRYREELHKGASSLDATVTALDTAGRAVVFAGITVVFSLMGLAVIGLPFMTGIGVAASTTVLVTMISSITLMPALLGFAGDRVEVSRYRGIVAAGFIALGMIGVGLGVTALAAAIPLGLFLLIVGLVPTYEGGLRRFVNKRSVKELRETLAYRWSRVVQARPWVVGGVGALALLIFSIPLLSLRLGFSDESNYPEDTTTRQAYDLVADGFGPGFAGPFLVTVEVGSTPADTVAQQIGTLSDAFEADPGVATVAATFPNNPEAPEAFVMQVIPTTGPQELATEHTLARLRDGVVPDAIKNTDLTVNITGGTAASVDFSDFLASRTPTFFGVVLLLSFTLLMAVFRSVLVPLKAVLMNLLSIGAAYGVVVAIFQWGWTSGLTGIEAGPIEPFIPIMLFAIVFGLSMDYEVFLLSRVREEFDRTGDAIESVADGLASTARVITAAAAIMIVVFGSFVLEDNRITQMFGTGLAMAIFLDATLVRMLLVPATMELLGARNWWMPRWLDRVVPNLNVEGA